MRLPLNTLQMQGHADVSWNGTYDARDFDVIVSQRTSNVIPHKEWITLANHRNRKYRLVFEIDDDLWHCEQSNTPAWNFYAMDQPRLQRLRECVGISDMVTCTTEPLARILRKMTDAPVVVLPNYIDREMLHIKHLDCDDFTIGTGGSPSHIGDWAADGEGIGKFLRRNPDVKMHFIGAEFTRFLPVNTASQVYMTPWRDVGEEYFRSLIMDVGVAPLKSCVFNNSKSSLKVLEYMALGIVPVVTDLLPYHDAIKEGKDGFLCKSPKEWYYALQKLRDKEVRAQMSDAGRRRASGLTIQEHAKKWLRAYETAVQTSV